MTGSELTKLMKIGTRVVRGQDWKWGEQDGPSGEGRIISEVGDDGYVTVFVEYFSFSLKKTLSKSNNIIYLLNRRFM